MLILRQQAHERIVVGDQIEIVVVRIMGKRVDLGIIAPPEIPIERREPRAIVGRRDRGERSQRVID